MSVNKIKFFGAADRQGHKSDGKITSEYPAWFLPQHMTELQHEIDQAEGAIRMGHVPQEKLYETKEELKRLKDRMAIIVKSKPKLSGKVKDDLHKIYEEYAAEISDSMFTRTEMKKGLVSAHEENRRNTEPIISDGGHGKVLANMNIIPRDGKISRNQASKAIKIIGGLLELPTNTEYFRKDQNFGTYKSDVPLHEVENS